MERSSIITMAAIAIVAFAFCDMVHEVLGHGTATLASSTVRATMLTTVALSTDGSSRMVAAAGTVANLAAAILAFWILTRSTLPATWRYFLWLFASVNLFNATGYFLYSGILGSGDWAVVIAGCEPQLLWRIGMVVVGAIAYAASVVASARTLKGMVGRGWVAAGDVNRMATLPYWVGGALLVLGAVPNPVSPVLILTSGAASGFGAMAGLLFVPRLAGTSASPPAPTLASTPAPASASPAGTLGLSRGWIATALFTAAIFIFVVGRGIHLG